jgi:hypothetical protein
LTEHHSESTKKAPRKFSLPSSLPHKGRAEVGFDRINLINGTTAGAILAVGMIKKGNT